MTCESRPVKTALYEQLATVGRALGSGPRLELLDLLCQGPRTVEALARETSQSVANASRHLQVLRRARLVEAEKRGVYVTYRVADAEVASFLAALRQLAGHRLLEIQAVTREFLDGRGEMEPVDREALIRRVRDGEVTVLDVRPAEEHAAGHLPGAVSVPLSELERRLDELPRDREIVAYCRGPYCFMAAEAVALLRARGFAATRLDEGVADWRARGLAVETLAAEASP